MPVINKTKSLSELLGLTEDSSSKTIVDILAGTPEDQVMSLVAPLISRGTITRKVGQVAPQAKDTVFQMLKKIPNRLLSGIQVGRTEPTLNKYMKDAKTLNQFSEIFELKELLKSGVLGGATDVKKRLATIVGNKSNLPVERTLFHEIGHLLTEKDITKSLKAFQTLGIEGTKSLSKETDVVIHNTSEILAEAFSQYAHKRSNMPNKFDKFPEEIQSVIKGLFNE